MRTLYAVNTKHVCQTLNVVQWKKGCPYQAANEKPKYYLYAKNRKKPVKVLIGSPLLLRRRTVNLNTAIAFKPHVSWVRHFYLLIKTSSIIVNRFLN